MRPRDARDRAWTDKTTGSRTDAATLFRFPGPKRMTKTAAPGSLVPRSGFGGRAPANPAGYGAISRVTW